jgi:hypothetical protein
MQVEDGSCRLGREPQSAACSSVVAASEWVNSRMGRGIGAGKSAPPALSQFCEMLTRDRDTVYSDPPELLR